jgi:hypothetical protein
MCDVIGCKKHPVKRINVTGSTPIGTVTRSVAVCSEHAGGLEEGQKPMYSMGCSIKAKGDTPVYDKS